MLTKTSESNVKHMKDYYTMQQSYALYLNFFFLLK